MRERLVELLRKDNCCIDCDCNKCLSNIHCYPKTVADLILADGWTRPPCKVGDVIYKVMDLESANGRPYKGDTLMDYEVVDMIEDCIDNAPTADVVEVKWIDVNERLPERDGENVLCYVRNSSTGGETCVVGGVRQRKHWFLQACNVGIATFPNRYWEVTHWMPLPEPPENDFKE